MSKSLVMVPVAALALLAMIQPVPGAGPDPLVPPVATAYPDDLLERVRAAATTIPGERAASIEFVKLAESHRARSGVIDGGSDDPFVSARTAFRISFPGHSIMLDSGMDEEVHRFYGFGREEPYWPERNAEVQAALLAASMVIITHEHGDHVAGVVRGENRRQIAPKTILTRDQVRTLVHAPQLPEITLTPADADDYIVVDYEMVLPVAPGVVLVKAAGHTPGHQMVYVALESGREYLFIGDIGWSLDNITEQRLRPAGTIARVKEDPEALTHQMRWIKQVMDGEGLAVVPSHDDALLARYVDEGLLGEGF